MERREMRAAEAEGWDYAPVTERGMRVHASRQAREVFVEMRERLELARETYDLAREDGQGRVSAGLAALRAAAGKTNERQGGDQIKERLERIVERDFGRDEPEIEGPDLRLQGISDRLEALLGRGAPEVGVDLGQAREPELQREQEKVREKGAGLDDDYGL
jgi:hypothetical protein